MKPLFTELTLMCFLTGSCTAAPTIETEPEIENGQEKTDENKTEDMTNPFNFETKTVKLNSGWEMPIIGIGTYLLSTAQAEESVYNALKVGMRLIDTADIYGNEVGVGRGIARAMKDFGIKREEIFVTTKLWTSDFYRADEEIDERLERLGLEYIDLLLLHHTAANDEHAYQAMERGVKAHIAPLGTILESWFPLGGRGTGIRTLNNLDVIKSIASAHGKSTYQVLLRWHLQSGVIAIPGSTNAQHIAEDYDIFDFSLTDAEMASIDALERNQRFASY